MFLPTNDKQFGFWAMRRSGVTNIAIANQLGSPARRYPGRSFSWTRRSRQRSARWRTQNQISVEKINAGRGILIGRSIPFRTAAIIFVSEKYGVQVWYEHDGDCGTCQRYTECIDVLGLCNRTRHQDHEDRRPDEDGGGTVYEREGDDMTLTRISEIIHEWTGWCPNALVQNIPQRRGSEDGSAFAAAVPRGERPAGSLTGGEVSCNHSAPTFIGGLKLVVAMVCIIIAASVLVTRAGLPWLYISPVAVALAYLFVQSVYSTVNVAVSHDSLEYWFGKGVRQKKIPLADIARCSVVKNPQTSAGAYGPRSSSGSTMSPGRILWRSCSWTGRRSGSGRMNLRCSGRPLRPPGSGRQKGRAGVERDGYTCF